MRSFFCTFSRATTYQAEKKKPVLVKNVAGYLKTMYVADFLHIMLEGVGTGSSPSRVPIMSQNKMASNGCKFWKIQSS